VDAALRAFAADPLCRQFLGTERMTLAVSDLGCVSLEDCGYCMGGRFTCAVQRKAPMLRHAVEKFLSGQQNVLEQ
jgi:hypothetical protein